MQTVARDVVTVTLGETETELEADDLASDAERRERDLELLARLYSREEIVSLFAGLLGERPESDRWADRLESLTEQEYLDEVFRRNCPIDPAEAETLAAEGSIVAALETISDLAAETFSFTAEDDDGLENLQRLAELLPEDGIEDAPIMAQQQLFMECCATVTSNDGNVYSRSHYYAGSATRWSDHDRGDDHDRLNSAFETLIDELEPGDRERLEVDLEAAERAAPFVFAIARVYRAVRDEYERRKAGQNALDYSDLIEQTIAFLEANETARDELREQFAYLMVDEVQDTDPRQWELVSLLSGTDPTAFDGENVFLVGDEKQSIYRFRNADVTMFRRARRRLTDANPDDAPAARQLTGNFRTLTGPLQFINDVFDELFEDGGPAYEAEPQRLTARREDGTAIEGDVEYLVVPDPADPSDDEEAAGEVPDFSEYWFSDETFTSRADREATAVAARLTQLFADPPQIYDDEHDEYRAAEPSDVALLFRTTTRLAAFERAFEDHDIPYTSLAGDGFYELPEIQPLVNLFAVLENPTRDIPLYGVLRSPLFGFTDETLAQFFEPDEALWEQLDEATGQLASAAETIAEWRQAAGPHADQPTKLARLVSRVIDETGYLVSIGADERPQQAGVNVTKFREQLRTWEEGGALPIADLLERIERERSAAVDPDEASIPAEETGVQLRTVHSSKGLEFPIVVVPELGRGSRDYATITSQTGQFAASLAYLEAIDDEPVLGIKAPGSETYGTVSTPDYELCKEVQAAELRAESKRILYVAMTRARDRLVLSSTHSFDPDGEGAFGDYETDEDVSCWRDWLQPLLLEDRGLVDEVVESGYVECSLGGSQYSVRLPPEPTAGPGDAAALDLDAHVELPDDPAVETRERLSATEFRTRQHEADRKGAGGGPDSQDRPESSVASMLPERTAGELSATDFGTLVHKLCELELSGAGVDWDETPRLLVDDPASVPESEFERARDHALVGINHVRELEADLDVVATYDELPVTLELSDRQISGEIDHLTVTPDRYYVTDYKTDDLSGTDAETEAKKYWPQLQVYACALQQAHEKAEVVLRLAFTGSDAIESERYASIAPDDLQEI
jgi:ATP-dependent helicase/nuclease subunit A